ncbi:MAG: GPW/gp25 family protein [Ginsengibacter sp.]
MSDEFTSNDFLGVGWSFPPTFNLQIKGVEMTEKEIDIERSLQILLTTALGERVMEPKYGCNMDSLLFEPLNTTVKTIMIDKIETAILFFEPRVDAQKINLNLQDELEGKVLIEINYIVRSTNSRYNFVFPYYINEGTELDFLTTGK